MIIDLNKKNAVICGGSKGMGKAIAMEFARAGASVTLIARNEGQLNQTKQELPCPKQNQHHSYLVADFSQPETLKEKFLSSEVSKGTVHILVNNNGTPPANSLLKTETSEILHAFSSFLLSYQVLAQLIIPKMKQENYGRIINIVSSSAKQPIPQLATLSIVSSAVKSWAKSLSNEIAPWGITVNNVLPGSTKTETLMSFYRHFAKSAGKSVDTIIQEKISIIPMNRLAEPEEIAYAVTFLASPLAGYITGADLPIDGGKLQGI
ncbi:short-chain dehydrogenase [Candidatus Magnetomorum sp. HK-1]|nr:short-chain dehydrogenase [Candidatus Magnetomorum sp. HK-1]